MPIFVIAAFAVLGALAFCACALVRPTRRFAMPAALSCLGFGCALLANILFFGLITLGAEKIPLTGKSTALPRLEAAVMWLAAAVAFVETILVVLLHGWIARRLTRALFRIYLIFVAAGVGLISGVVIALYVSNHVPHPYKAVGFASTALFPICLCVFCWRKAPDFRGARPETMQPVLQEEY